jgi:hypothetical protein
MSWPEVTFGSTAELSLQHDFSSQTICKNEESEEFDLESRGVL